MFVKFFIHTWIFIINSSILTFMSSFPSSSMAFGVKGSAIKSECSLFSSLIWAWRIPLFVTRVTKEAPPKAIPANLWLKKNITNQPFSFQGFYIKNFSVYLAKVWRWRWRQVTTVDRVRRVRNVTVIGRITVISSRI